MWNRTGCMWSVLSWRLVSHRCVSGKPVQDNNGRERKKTFCTKRSAIEICHRNQYDPLWKTVWRNTAGCKDAKVLLAEIDLCKWFAKYFSSSGQKPVRVGGLLRRLTRKVPQHSADAGGFYSPPPTLTHRCVCRRLVQITLKR